MATVAHRKPYFGVQMEGPIARWYARITGRDLRPYREAAAAVAARLAPGSAVLEVAPGPGYLAIELARLGAFRVSGLDISHSFVRMSRRNAQQAGVAVDFQQGDVAHMPYPAESFDAVVCRAAFKNFPDGVAALDEMHRVLKPGGQATILDLRKDAPLAAIDEEVRGMHLSPLNAWLTRWSFRTMLLREAYTLEKLEGVVARSRFGRGDIRLDGIGFELRLTK